MYRTDVCQQITYVSCVEQGVVTVRWFQGPALYAYNDALFTEQDWKGVRMLSESIKQDDPTKVGYFGMGFKSVFHLTGMT